MERHIEPLSPTEGVAETFEKAGFLQSFEFFSDLQERVAAL